eukprot:GHUV01035880.1.p1 GENE.GHUV01035880.1~~GHUV01035880.1.p1  ORF type:complete len:145 (+),score=22.96 GHUV01035880.1:183-617(+)
MLVVFTAAHVASSLLMVKLGGAAGLVLADAFSMLLRIVYSLRFIRQYFQKVPGFSIWQVLPSPSTLGACTLASACLAGSDHYFMSSQQLTQHGFWRQAGMHVGAGVGCLAVLLLRISKAEGATAQQLVRLRRGAVVEETDKKGK